MNRTRISALVMITGGAVMGYVAASSGARFDRSASAAGPPETVSGTVGTQATCSTGLSKNKLLSLAGPTASLGAVRTQENAQAKKPNIVTIMADDIGWFNIGAYHRGMMAGRTPNLDRLASQGMLFTDYYAEASCTAGRANFITGELPIRTGLTTVG
jgi:arylsulfatase